MSEEAVEDSAPEVAAETAPETTPEVQADPDGIPPELEAEASAAEEATAETPEAPKPPEQKPATVSALLAARAARAGMDDAELAEFTSDVELERALKLIERRKPTDEKKDSATPSGDEVKIDEIPDLDEAQEWDPAVLKGWKAMKAHISHQTKTIERLIQADQRRAADEEVSWFEGSLSTLPDAENLFGKGRYADLDPKSAQVQNREKLWWAKQDVAKHLHARGEHISRSELLTRAYRLAFGEQIETAQRKEIAAKLAARTKQVIHPPSQRESSTGLTGDEKARKSIEKLLAAKKQRSA